MAIVFLISFLNGLITGYLAERAHYRAVQHAQFQAYQHALQTRR